MKGAEVGRFYLPEIDKVFVTYMFDPKDIQDYDNKEDMPISCNFCGEMGMIVNENDRVYCQKCGNDVERAEE